MVDEDKKTIISLFAHPDDELGSIGTLANHVQRGDRVIMAWTTYGELTTLLPDLNPEEIKLERTRHGEEIAKIVGAEKAVFLDMGDSMVENTHEQRVALARLYAKEKPDAVVSWGLNNNHSDHRNTGYLSIEAIKFARINRIVGMEPHRKNVVLLQYFEPESKHPVYYVDVSDVLEQVKAAAEFYAGIYQWKRTNGWVVDRRRARGLESGCEYAEKYNIRFADSQPSKYVI